MQKDPKKRPTIAQIMNDEYFVGIDWKKLEQKQYEPPPLTYNCEDELSDFDRVSYSHLNPTPTPTLIWLVFKYFNIDLL